MQFADIHINDNDMLCKMPDPNFIDILQCPKTGESLAFQDNQLVSSTSHEHYPLMNGIPWLHPNPLHSMVDWSVKLNHFYKVITAEIDALENDLSQADTITHDRLNRVLDGKRAFLEQVTDLISPIVTTKVASKPIYDALSDRAPNTQNLLSYEANLYRDWVWGEEENELSCNLIIDTLEKKDTDKLLIVGAGACRLAYDLHINLTPSMTVANDINPMLLFSAQRILHESGLEIVEFPMQPKAADNVAIHHKIPRMEHKPENLYLLFSDAAKPAIKAKSMDVIVTPWLIDIQPFELKIFLRSLNHYLDIGGYWVNFGSLVFSQGRDSLCYAIGEMEAIAEACGFKIERLEQKEMPYLKSPYNAGWRMENIWCWRAKKVSDVKADGGLQHLPEWILDTSVNVPLSNDIKNTAFSYKTYNEILSLNDGKHSLSQMARRFARKKNMDEQETVSMFKTFYMKALNLK